MVTTNLLLDSADVIWPEATHKEIVRTHRASARTVDYLVLPGVKNARWLLPAGQSQTAGALVGQGQTRLRRGTTRMGQLAHEMGFLRRLPVARLRVLDPEPSLLGAVQDLLEIDVAVAIRLGSWNQTRSLVLRAFDSTGTTVCFAKVGVDTHGHAAVAAEFRALQRVAQLGLRSISHPNIIRRSTWRSLDLLLVSPLEPVARRESDALPIEAMREFVRAAGSRSSELSDSRWWASAHDRTARISERETQECFRETLRQLHAAALGSVLPLAPWHGDWVPWNMARDGARVRLWDWEHFADDVPVGFDQIHYLAQQLRTTQGTGPDAERAWRQRSEICLAHEVGLDPHQRAVVRLAYLIDVNLRFTLDRQFTSDVGVRRQGWGLELMVQEARSL